MARIDPSAVWDFAREVVGRGKSDHGRTLATVTRIGADGTVWVTTGDGGEAPAMSVAAGVSIGDTVALEWDGSSMGVRANVSDPPPAGNVVVKQVDAIRTEVVETAALVADKASVGQLEAESARIDSLQAATADIDTIRANSAKVANLTAQQLEADHATISTLDTNYMHANMSNSDVAWISNGVIANGAITNAMINGVSANKLTAGTINGDVINVTNLNANNITTGTINGQRIGTGSLSLDKLSEDVYTEAEVDDKLSTMQAEIDGAIETWTGTEVPTLNNAPASGWTTDAIKDTHVGDVYFVVNSQSQQNGYNYRFTKSGSTYSWQLIKDSDVTAALSRLQTAEGKITTFDSDISTLKTDTGTLTTKTESLETRMSDAEEDILDKVDTTTFNEVSNTVDQHTQTITQHTTAISKKADNSTVTAVTNRVSKNEQDISGINTTIGSLQTTVESKADGSTVTTISDKLNTVSDTVDGHTQSISSINNTLTTKADGSTVTTLTTKVNDISDTVDGHTQSLQSVTETQTSIQKNAVKSTVQLWFTKADTTAPGKPTAHVTTNNAATGNAWNLAVPTYNSAYPNYYYCYEYQYVDGSYDWSAVTRDIATGEMQERARTAFTNAAAADTKAGNAATAAATADGKAVSAQNTANKNVKESQQLWFTKANGSAPAKPTSAVTSTATTGNAWTTKVPTYSSTYPHYFYCMQYKLADGTYTWSDVVYDQATTEAQSVARTASANLTTLQQDYATYKQTTTENVSSIGTRLSTAEGKISTAESSITQNAQNIELKVSKDGVISSINQSAESVKIQASKVEIDGTAVFNAAKSKLDAAYDAKGAAATAKSEAISAAATDATNKVNAVQIGGRNLIGKFNWDNSTADRGKDRYSIDPTGVVSSSSTDSTLWGYNNSQWYANLDAGTYQLTIFVDTKCEAWTSASCQVFNSAGNVIASDFGNSVFNNGGKQTKAFTLASNTDIGIKVKPGKGCVFRIKLENGTKATDWTPAPEDQTAYADEIRDAIVSRGEQLVINGNGFMGDNTNFTNLTFDGGTSNNSPGSFTRAVGNTNVFTDEMFPVDVSKEYIAEFDVKSGPGGAKMYAMLAYFDVDKRPMTVQHVSYIDGSTTTLARELKNGDTKVYLTSVAGFNKSVTANHQRALIFWNYTNSYGYTYPPETYSRKYYTDLWADSSSFDTTNNTITLKAAWSKGTFPAGTSVSQSTSGNNYAYFWYVTNKTLFPITWTRISGTYRGVKSSGDPNAGTVFWPGTAYCKIGWLWNYEASSTDVQDQIWVTNVSVKEHVASSSDAVKRTQRIWYRKSASGAPPTPGKASSNWVTKADDGNDAWTKMHVAISSTHKYIYTCEQYEMANGTVGYTSVLLDNTITVIDGGNIITGSVTANKLNASDINASNSLTIGALSTSTQDDILNSKVVVGGRNLLAYSGTGKNWGYSTFADGVYTRSTTGTAEVYISGKTIVPLELGETYTFSAWMKTNGQVSSVDMFLYDGNVKTVRSKNFGAITTEWNFYTWTVTMPNAWVSGSSETAAWNARFDNNGSKTSGTEAILYVKQPKLEKGNKATDWTPAPEDVDASVEAAAKTATNYISVDSTGIRIADSNPANATTYQHQTATNTEFVVNNASVASFGGDGVRIGKGSESHMEFDYHSMSMTDSGGTEYLIVSDLRDRTGYATVKHPFYGDGTTRDFMVSMPATSTESVTVDGEPANYYYRNQSYSLNTAPAEGALVLITYKTNVNWAKAFTFGIRNSSYDPATGDSYTPIGPYSAAFGVDCTADGYASFAAGDHASANGNFSAAFGHLSRAGGNAFAAAGGHAAGSNSAAFGGEADGESSFAACSPYNEAKGLASSVFGHGAIASGDYQTAMGRYNEEDANGDFAFIVGNGADEENRSNAFTVDWDGRVQGHMLGDPTDGDRYGTASQSSSVSVATGTGKAICSHEFGPGVYVIVGHVQFASNATGYRACAFSTTSGSVPDSGYGSMQASTNALNGRQTHLSVSLILSVSSTSTLYLNALHNRGSALNAVGQMRWVRLL